MEHMATDRIVDTNIVHQLRLPTPNEVITQLPASPLAHTTVHRVRQSVREILAQRDSRLLVIVGPCSIHDERSALEYAERLQELAPQLEDVLLPVMRVYFEKPRTVAGWKGFINDPHLDDSFRIEEGLFRARALLVAIAERGLGAATEVLDPIVPQYLSDLISWSAIGARTIESQTHREIASGLSCPVGFKNGTDGSLAVAVNAIKAAARAHHFLGLTHDGHSAVFHTAGNRDAHIVLRGGALPNYDRVSVARCTALLHAAGLPVRMMIDCSHANSGKDPHRQAVAFRDCLAQRLAGNEAIIGLMLESNLNWGQQPIPADPRTLRYGVSLTDACIDWETTALILREAADQLRASAALKKRSQCMQAAPAVA